MFVSMPLHFAGRTRDQTSRVPHKHAISGCIILINKVFFIYLLSAPNFTSPFMGVTLC